MNKAKFYVDFCFEAGDAGLCHRYWFEIEFSSHEFEELYQIWYDQNCELNSWAMDWDGHESLFKMIDSNAVYSLNQMLAEYEPKFASPVEVLWELSKETINCF